MIVGALGLLGGLLLASPAPVPPTAAKATVAPGPTYVAMLVHFDSPASMRGEDLAALRRLARKYPEVRWTYLFNPIAYVERTPLLGPLEAFLRGQLANAKAELGLHLHSYEAYVVSAGVRFRSAPSVYDLPAMPSSDRSGYSVPITVYSPEDMRKLFQHALRLFEQHGWPRPRTFGAGFFTSSPAMAKELVELRFEVHASATPAGEEIGKSFGGSWRALAGWGDAVRHDTSPYCIAEASIQPGHGPPFLIGPAGPLVELPQTGKCDWMMSAADMKKVAAKNVAKSRETGQPTIVSFVIHDFLAAAHEARFAEVFDALRAEQARLREHGGDGLRFGTATEIRRALLAARTCSELVDPAGPRSP